QAMRELLAVLETPLVELERALGSAQPELDPRGVRQELEARVLVRGAPRGAHLDLGEVPHPVELHGEIGEARAMLRARRLELEQIAPALEAAGGVTERLTQLVELGQQLNALAALGDGRELVGEHARGIREPPESGVLATQEARGVARYEPLFLHGLGRAVVRNLEREHALEQRERRLSRLPVTEQRFDHRERGGAVAEVEPQPRDALAHAREL